MNYIYHLWCRRMESYGLRVITDAVNEPITLAETWLHLRLDAYGSPLEHPDDAWLTEMIPAARQLCEMEHGSSMAPQVLELSLQGFPTAYRQGVGDLIALPMGPVAGVQSVSYTDSTGAVVTLTEGVDYTVDLTSDPCYVYPYLGTCWPAPALVPGAVKIRYNAGYTTASDSPNDMPLPKFMRSAILLTLGHLYENREATTDLVLTELPMGVKSLLSRNKQRMGFA